MGARVRTKVRNRVRVLGFRIGLELNVVTSIAVYIW